MISFKTSAYNCDLTSGSCWNNPTSGTGLSGTKGHELNVTPSGVV